MKTTHKILTNVIAAILALNVSLAMAAPKDDEDMGWFKKTFAKLEWSELPTVVASPKDICKRVRSSIEFRAESGDKWATGVETWNRGWGDCEDFAACVTDLCRSMNLDAKIVVFKSRGSREAHAVAVGTYNGKMWISSNGWYANVANMQEAKKAVAEEMGWETRNVSVTSLRASL